MILESNSILGFNFYKRVRLYDKPLVLKSSKIHCDDIGLYVIGKYPNLEYNFVSVFPKQEWGTIAFHTINLAIFNLVLTGTISIHGYEDEVSYLSGLKKSKKRDYYFKIEDISTDEDLLTKSILSAINQINEEDIKIKTLRHVIQLVLDKYLGSKEVYGRPQKQFVIELLRRYSKKYDWLKIVHTEKLLGIYRDYKIEIEPIYIPRIKMQHQDLIVAYKNEIMINRPFIFFKDTVYNALEIDFRRREPSDD